MYHFRIQNYEKKKKKKSVGIGKSGRDGLRKLARYPGPTLRDVSSSRGAATGIHKPMNLERQGLRVKGEKGKRREIRNEINTWLLGDKPLAFVVRVDRVPPPVTPQPPLTPGSGAPRHPVKPPPSGTRPSHVAGTRRNRTPNNATTYPNIRVCVTSIETKERVFQRPEFGLPRTHYLNWHQPAEDVKTAFSPPSIISIQIIDLNSGCGTMHRFH